MTTDSEATGFHSLSEHRKGPIPALFKPVPLSASLKFDSERFQRKQSMFKIMKHKSKSMRSILDLLCEVYRYFLAIIPSILSTIRPLSSCLYRLTAFYLYQWLAHLHICIDLTFWNFLSPCYMFMIYRHGNISNALLGKHCAITRANKE